MINTLDYITQKYGLKIGHQIIVDIPNMGRDNLAELFSELKFKKGAEIGVDWGGYSEILCKANSNLHLYSIDPWKTSAYEPGGRDVMAFGGQKTFDKTYKDAKKRLAPYNCTILRKFSMEALKDFKDNSLDFAYIDANHDFVNFTNDLHYWLKKIRPGGIMSCHDYCYFSY